MEGMQASPEGRGGGESKDEGREAEQRRCLRLCPSYSVKTKAGGRGWVAHTRWLGRRLCGDTQHSVLSLFWESQRALLASWHRYYFCVQFFVCSKILKKLGRVYF